MRFSYRTPEFRSNAFRSYLIAVIIPFYNSIGFLTETITSVKNQTYSDWECLLIDDGSDDGSEQIAQDAQKNDRRFRYILDPDKGRGVSASRNLGIELANGEYVLFLDSDDLLLPDTLDKREYVMRNAPELEVAFFQVEAFGLDSFLFTTLKKDYIRSFLSFDFPFQTSSSFWKVTFLKQLGGFRTDMTHLEDPEFHLRALSSTHAYLVLPYTEPDVMYRVWKRRSEVYSDSLLAEIRSYLSYTKSALEVAEKTSYPVNSLRRGLYLMLVRVRWAFDREIPQLLLECIQLLEKQKIISGTRSKLLRALLGSVPKVRPRIHLEIMAMITDPAAHLRGYTDAITNRFS